MSTIYSAFTTIVFADSTNFSVHIPSTRLWPLARLYWDMKGLVDANDVYPLAYGELPIDGDITRSV